MATNANIARYLGIMAMERPDQIAVLAGAGKNSAGKPIYRQLTFAELELASNRYAWGLNASGIKAGTKVLLLVPAGLPLISLSFALLKIGAVPIMIDPAMGRRNLATCIAECEPEVMVGVSRGHLARFLFRRAFRTVRQAIFVGSRFIPLGDMNLSDLSAPVSMPYPSAELAPDDTAAILFTTGSTGVPKGVIYEHGMFEAQVQILRTLFGIAPGEVEMPAFPLFALFNVALGITSAIPPIDPTRPASCDPAEVLAFMQDRKVTSTFGSPAIWNKISAYCLEHQVKLPLVRRILMAGAPVPPVLHQRFQQILTPPHDTHTPYGATEALPIASATGSEVLAALAERNDPLAGTCVGRAVPGVKLRIIPICDDPIAQWDEAQVLPPNQVGEICVQGKLVTKAYVNRPSSTALAKIADPAGIWHRMGDLGYLDEQGRLWFYGRKTHRVQTSTGTLYTEPVELVFNQHAAVYRSALVGVVAQQGGLAGRVKRLFRRQAAAKSAAQIPVLLVELRPEAKGTDQKALLAELHALAASTEMTKTIRHILIHPAFPVDIRHNAKIFREKLAVWAAPHIRQ